MTKKRLCEACKRRKLEEAESRLMESFVCFMIMSFVLILKLIGIGEWCYVVVAIIIGSLSARWRRRMSE
jgi:hypothetical protein